MKLHTRRGAVLITLLSLLLLVLTACDGDGRYSGTWIAEGEHVLEEGETLSGELIVSGGEMWLQEGSTVEGSLFVLGGGVRSAGKIEGDAFLMLGRLALEPGAVVGGDLNLGGGTLEQDPSAVVEGETVRGSMEIPETGPITRGDVLTRVFRALIEAPFFAALNYLTMRRFPGRMQNLRRALFKYPLVSGSLGLLAWIAGLSLLVLMAFTVLLIPVSLGLFAAMFLATAWGLTPLVEALGRPAASILGRKESAVVTALLGGLIWALIFELSDFIPVVGFLPGLLALLTGLGSVLLTRFGATRYTPPTDVSGEYEVEA